MEHFNLVYLHSHRVLLCKEHGYCLTKKTARRHLWSHHAAKGTLAQMAVQELQELDLAEPPSISLPTASSEPVPGLPIRDFFRCALDHCDGEPAACSQRKETVVKHQSKTHRVGARKATKPSESSIECIYMQSFFPHPLLQWFPVQPAKETQARSSTPGDSMQSRIQQAVSATKEAWREQLDVIPAQELHAAQTPPWLITTGISPFVERLRQGKPEILGLRSSPVAIGMYFNPLACSHGP